MSFKRIMTYSKQEKKVRLFALLWKDSKAGKGDHFARRLSFSLRPRLFQFWTEFDAWFLTIAGVQVHFKRSYWNNMV